MKHILKVITAALSVVCLTSCGDKVTKTSEQAFPGSGYQDSDFVAIKEFNERIALGEKGQIDLEGLPSKYLSNLTFTSKDPSVVSVSSSGELTGVGKGTTYVEVKYPDGRRLGKVNVIVTANDSTDVVDTIANITDDYADPSYEAPTKVHELEYSYEAYYKEGKVDHSSKSIEELYYNKDGAYFMVGGDDLYTYTADGASELAGGKWIFDVQDMNCRMMRITDTSKNYFDFNCGDYDDDNQVIYDLLDMFFVSGRKIIDDLFDNYSGKDSFEWYTPFYPSEGMYAYADGKNDLYLGMEFFTSRDEEDADNEVTAEDELVYFDIPAGTKYDDTTTIAYIYEGNKCNGMSIDVMMDYELDGVKWKRDFIRSELFDDEYEEEIYDGDDQKMKNDGWAKVDSMYDL